MMKVGCIVCTVLSLVTGSGAVIVAGGDGTQNTTAPAGGQGWDYVGRITSANGAPSSVTYLDNNWFITAYHVKSYDNPTGVLLGGLSYSIDLGSFTRLTNTQGGDADLVMFRVNGSVGLSGLTVRSSALANDSALTMIGNGRNREITETSWNSSWNEVTPPPRATYSGYKWASGSTKRWGTNNMDADGILIDSGSHYITGEAFGVTDTFYTTFDDIGGSEAQGATYDSGGGAFFDNGTEWELAGITITAGPYSGQPADTSVYGNRTYMADIHNYADQINATTAIPEPAVIVFVSIFGFGLLFVKRLVT